MNRILYIQYTNPAGYPPLQHSSRILAGAGWNVLFLGTGAAGANDLEFPPAHNLKVWRMPFCAAGWRQKLHYLKYCLWALLVTLIWRPKWVYASDPLSCMIALILTWLPGLRVIYHEHDTPMRNQRESRFLTLSFRARKLVAQRADLCILPNAKRLEWFVSESGPLRSSACVWNCPGLYEATATVRIAAQPPFRVLYHGSIVPERLPPAVLDGLALLPESVVLRVVGYETVGSQGYLAALQRQARILKIEHRVEFLAAIHRSELMKATAQSDIGLALIPASSSDQNFQSMPGASNKAFDYLACGLPVIVSDLCEWHEMFVAPGYGLECNPSDAQSIAAAIGWLTEHPEQMRAMGESGRKRILSEWNYENVFQPVMQYLATSDSAANTTAKDPRLQNAQ